MHSTIAAWLARYLGALGFIVAIVLGYEEKSALPQLVEHALWTMLGAGAVGLIIGNLMGSLMNVEEADETTMPQTDEMLPASLPPL